MFGIDFVFPFKLGGAVYENGDSDMSVRITANLDEDDSPLTQGSRNLGTL